jgi:hypothetical protein
MTDEQISKLKAPYGLSSTQKLFHAEGKLEAIREALAEQEKYIKKLEFMIINGLGPKDIEDDRRTD